MDKKFLVMEFKGTDEKRRTKSISDIKSEASDSDLKSIATFIKDNGIILGLNNEPVTEITAVIVKTVSTKTI